MSHQPFGVPPVAISPASGTNVTRSTSIFFAKTEPPFAGPEPVLKTPAIASTGTGNRGPQHTSIFAHINQPPATSTGSTLFKPINPFEPPSSSVSSPDAPSTSTSTGLPIFNPADTEKLNQKAPLFVTSLDPVKTEWASYYWDRGFVSYIVASSNETVQLCSNLSEVQDSVVTVHKGLLIHFSPYYCTVLKDRSEEHNDRPLILEVSKETLSNLVSWLYTGSIPPEGSRKRKRNADSEEAPRRLYQIYLELYVLGESHKMLALRRWSLDQLRQLVTPKGGLGSTDLKNFTRDEICFAFDSLPDHSPMRKWITTCYTYHYKPSADEKLSDWAKVHPDFLAGVMLGQATWIKLCVANIGKSCTCCQAIRNECAYHEHESEKERLATCNNFAPVRSELESLFFKEWN